MITSLDNINSLSSVSIVKQISQSLAMLDAIIMPDWELRYFSFDSKWDELEMMASMKNGSGDEYFLLFNASGAVGKVFTKNNQLFESETIKLLSDIPSEFESFKEEEAFNLDNMSYCFWNIHSMPKWVSKPTSTNLAYLNFLTGKTEVYKIWAEEYYEKELDFNAIQEVLSYKPISNDIITALNKEVTLESLMEEIEEIGYPKL